MLCVKVPLKQAEKMRKALMAKNLLDTTYSMKRKDGFILFPVRERIEGLKADYADCRLERREKKKDFKESLSSKLTKEELEMLKTSMDVIGSIAIVEIPDELKKREKTIALELLKANKYLKTVLRKGKHEGVFRVQKLKHLAGAKTKEALHRENNVVLKLDVEKVYFSPRLSNDRKRVAGQIKRAEDVLVMFSGCAPYVCAIAKNTPARYVYGIEINPEGHRYGMENLRLNKIRNAFLMQGDVKKAAPKFYQHIVGLKSNIEPGQLKSKIKNEPGIIELYTYDHDFGKGFAKLKKTIADLTKRGLKVMVHQPFIDNESLDLVNYDATHPIYSAMIKLIRDADVDVIIHPVHRNVHSDKHDDLIKNIRSFSKYYDRIFFENHITNIFSKKNEIIQVIKETGMKNVCLDTCHLLYLYSEEELKGIISELQGHCNTYFHLSSYWNSVHGSKLDLRSESMLTKIMPLITCGVVEVNEDHVEEGRDMIASWNYLSKFQKKFDRILMPLPKSAGEFLPEALRMSSKGTIIHFYDFQSEADFEKSVEKITEACKDAGLKFRVLEIVKCGQHAPRIFRICVDFQII